LTTEKRTTKKCFRNVFNENQKKFGRVVGWIGVFFVLHKAALNQVLLTPTLLSTHPINPACRPTNHFQTQFFGQRFETWFYLFFYFFKLIIFISFLFFY
jgi:hypothetical protein